MTCALREYRENRFRLVSLRTQSLRLVEEIHRGREEISFRRDRQRVWAIHFRLSGCIGNVPKCTCDECVTDAVMRNMGV